ncbi:MAG: L-lactate dehydrogenase [Anaerolineales bacterium]|nr:L-lactate dehydrogenase [Anaerolineales bacterium]
MKTGIIGAGNVGATATYTLVMEGVGREVVLVDIDQKRAQAEVDDISHAVPFSNSFMIKAGGYEDLKDCKVVVITAGAAQKPGETRLHLLEKNARIFDSIISEVLKYAPEAILLVATNPVDLMTYLTTKIAQKYGLPSTRVLGTGTTLDTARFRSLLAKRINVDPKNVHGYVIGEHGDSEVLLWSSVQVGGLAMDDFCDQFSICFDEEERIAIEHEVRNAAYTIIEGKGATYYGIGSAISNLVRAIIRNQNSIYTICTHLDEIAEVKDVVLAIPHQVNRNGVSRKLSLPMTSVENQALKKSAQVIRNAVDELEQSGLI